MLVFRDQNITDEEQIAFTRHFGELESYNTPGHVRRREDHRLGPGIADFSNLDKHGNIMSDEDRVWFFKLGGQSAGNPGDAIPVQPQLDRIRKLVARVVIG